MFIVFAAIPFFLYIVLAFFAVVLTPLCALAWNSPFSLGSFTIMPAAARAFVRRGLTVGFLVVFFTVFVCLMFNLPMPEDYWHHIFLAGYTMGSSFVEMLDAMQDEDPPAIEPEIVEPSIRPYQPPQQLPPPAAPFRYGSWDDEEDRR